MILKALRKKHLSKQRPDVFFAGVKNGPTHTAKHLLILDALAIAKSWTRPCFTGYEVKVSRSDFTSDEKWIHYLQYCHLFYFVCPTGLIEPAELPEEVGLMYYNSEKEALSTKKKALIRPVDIDWQMLYYLIIARSEDDRHPFFSSQREFLEAWVQDKEERARLGWRVRSKVANRLDELEKENEELKRRLEYQDRHKEELKKLKDLLKEHGVDLREWRGEEHLKQALSKGMPQGLTAEIERLQRQTQVILKMCGQEGVE